LRHEGIFDGEKREKAPVPSVNAVTQKRKRSTINSYKKIEKRKELRQHPFLAIKRKKRKRGHLNYTWSLIACAKRLAKKRTANKNKKRKKEESLTNFAKKKRAWRLLVRRKRLLPLAAREREKGWSRLGSDWSRKRKDRSPLHIALLTKKSSLLRHSRRTAGEREKKR